MTEKTRHKSQNSMARIQGRPQERGFGACVPFALCGIVFVCNDDNLRWLWCLFDWKNPSQLTKFHFQDPGASPKTRIWSVRALRSFFRLVRVQLQQLEVWWCLLDEKNPSQLSKLNCQDSGRRQNPGFEIFHECVIWSLCYALFVCNDDDLRWWRCLLTEKPRHNWQNSIGRILQDWSQNYKFGAYWPLVPNATRL